MESTTVWAPGRARERKAVSQRAAGREQQVLAPVYPIIPFPHYPSNLLHPDVASKSLLDKFWDVSEGLVEMKLMQAGFAGLIWDGSLREWDRDVIKGF